MNEVSPNEGEPDDLDRLYRHESELDSSRPSEWVRRTVLEHAARLAAQHDARKAATGIKSRDRATRRAWWQPAIFGTLSAAALAGLLMTPHFLSSPVPMANIPPASLLAGSAPPASPPSPSPPAAEEPMQAPSLASRAADVAAESSRHNPHAGPHEDAANPFPMQAAGAAKRSLGAVAAPHVTAASKPRATAGAPPPQLAAAQSAPAPAFTAPAAPAVPAAAAPAFSPPTPARAAPSALARSLVAGRPLAGAGPPTDPDSALLHAAEIGDVPAIRSLLDERVAIEARDAGGRTALMLATLHGQVDAVETLLARGADPNAADAQGTTPLEAALAGEQPKIVAALRRAGAR